MTSAVNMRLRSVLALATVSAISLAGLAPAAATDDSEGEHGDLKVELRPAVVDVGETVVVEAKLKHTNHGHGGHDDDKRRGRGGDECRDDDDEDDDDLEAAHDDHGAVECDDEDDDLDCEAVDDDDVEAATDDDCDDDDADESAGETLAVFDVDFGDGSPIEEMSIDKVRENKVEAVADHVYAAEGDYEVTVWALGEDGVEHEVTVEVSVGEGSARLDGEDRIETALRISRETFPEGGAGAVLLARSDAFADALAAATLALAEEAPVLLIPSGVLPVDVLAEIERVLGGTGSVHLLGGDSAIDPSVAEELELRGHEVTRIAGDDRVATSVAIADFIMQSGASIDEVVLASAVTFPDALSGAAYAAAKGAPVVLTAPDALSPAVADLLQRLGTDTAVTVVGGTAGVSDAVVDELVALGFDVERLAGDDRYDTAVEVAERGNAAPTVIVIATGESFPDALAGGAFAGRNRAPLLLVGDSLPDSVADYLAEHGGSCEVLVILGGVGAVPPEVMAELEALLGL